MRLFLIAVLAVAAPTAAQQPAQQPRVDGRRVPELGRQGPTIVAEPLALALAGFDADQDGRVTRAEAAAGAARSYAAVAGNAKDIGFIGYSDWCLRWLGDAHAAPGPYEADTSRDQRISADEIAAVLLGAFARFDKDRDGVLTRAELVTVRATAFGDDGRRKGKQPPPPPRQ